VQFLIETERACDSSARVREVAVVPTLADVHRLAGELAGVGELTADLAASGGEFEGQLSGEWGSLRFAPAA
jgi:hypothetical protein